MIGKLLILIVAVSAVTGNKIYQGVDPNTLRCDPLGTEFLLLPHFTDCSKFFMCTHGKEAEFSCVNGLLFDFEIQSCNWAEEVNCILRGDNNLEEGSGAEDPEWIADGDDKDPKQDALGKAVLFSDQILNCKNNADAAKHVAYRGDCQRFWRCSNGLPVAEYCSDGLFFNEKKQQCDFEANVRCNANEHSDLELNGEFIY